MPKKSKKVIFQAIDNQSSERGEPPQLDPSDTTKYYAYFEGFAQEQFIFTYDYQTHSGMLWHSKKGWDQPIPVENGKVSKYRLDEPVKNWLKACWRVVAQIDAQKQYFLELQKQREQPPKPVERVIPSHQELLKRGGSLYDALVKNNAGPNCSRLEFIEGWVGFMEVAARFDAKRKERSADTAQDQENSALNTTK